MKTAKIKKVKNLKKGDRVELTNGNKVAIKSILKGFFPNSKLLVYSNGDWGCLNDDVEVRILSSNEVKNKS